LQSNKFVVGSLTQNKKKICFLFISHEETTSFVPPLQDSEVSLPNKKQKFSKESQRWGTSNPKENYFHRGGEKWMIVCFKSHMLYLLGNIMLELSVCFFWPKLDFGFCCS
jgi:hypothetical protein